MIGQTVSHYRIVEKLGGGAMGVVYLAEDTHLGRRVAIKFLTEDKDHHYRARFLREARAVSMLSHSHIAIIHDYGETASGQPFIVMEYIKGRTLGDLLNKSALTINQAVRIIEAITEGLGAAHARGIIHRDIKPTNVLVNEEGDVKVVDFGLVKQLGDGQTPESTPDANTLMTRTASNMIVGTPLYLSPEQAMGAEVDARSDLFAIGALLYECLAGRPAFSGGSVLEIGAQILHFNPPPPSAINHRVSQELDRITLKALEKKRESRYQSAGELVADLRATRLELTDEDGHRTQRLVPSKATHSSAFKSISESLSRPRLSIGFFALALIVVAVVVWLIIRPGKTTLPFQNMRITKLTNSGKTVDAAISPDGKYLAEVVEEGGLQTLWLRQVGEPIASKQVVAAVGGQYEGLTFTPDGNNIYYVVWENNAHDVLYKIAVLGSAAQKLPIDVNSPVSFSTDGQRMAFIRRSTNRGESALITANADGTEERIVARRREPLFFSEVAPAWSEDGKVLACSVRSSVGGFRGTVVEVRVADGVERQITTQSWAIVERVAWLKGGRGLVITAAEQSSSPFQIWHVSYPDGALHRITNDLDSYVGLSLSQDSSKLVSVNSNRLSSLWVVPNGDAGRATQLTSGVTKHFGLTWTPDGKLVYSSIASGNADIWTMNPDGTNPRQLTTDVHADRDPSVSPDNRYITFASDRSGKFNIWRMDSDGNNQKKITDGDDEEFPQISPDGHSVVYQGFVNGVPTLWRITEDGSKPVQLTNSYSNWPVVSPDGKWIACSYLDEESARWKLAVFPFDGGAPTKTFDMPMPYLQHFVWQKIRWTADGQALTYIDRRGGISNIWSQPLSGGDPRQLTDFKADQIFNFAWSADGKQLACARGVVTSDAVLISEFK
jgi:serine/threonine protein kinase/Tol biopolymer transport system component